MAVRTVTASGLAAVELTTTLLQRVRSTDPRAGMWEAADIQWWWRKPRRSDEVEQVFWVDERGPVATVRLTSEDSGSWQCDPILVPDAPGVDAAQVWAGAWEQVGRHVPGAVEVPVRDDDPALKTLVEGAGLVAGHGDTTAWIEIADRPRVLPPPEGFVLVDRTQRAGTPHPMHSRSGADVAERLAALSLYDPGLDVAVEAVDGRAAGYSLYWYDPVTETGLVEPVRVEDEFQRLGLARAMLTAGIERLAARGARRVKISFSSQAAGDLYQGVGFRPTSRDTWYVGQTPGPPAT